MTGKLSNLLYLHLDSFRTNLRIQSRRLDSRERDELAETDVCFT
jgi:hypothetical protein